MFNTKEVTTKQTTNSLNKYLSWGISEVKINKIVAHKAKTGNYQLKFEVETPPVTTEGFVPAEGYFGQVGTVSTQYINKPEVESKVASLIADLANELGVREEVDAITSETYEEYCDKLTQIVSGKYLYLSINGREYVNDNTGKKGTNLQFPPFKSWATKDKYEEKGESALFKPSLYTLLEQGTTPSTNPIEVPVENLF